LENLRNQRGEPKQPETKNKEQDIRYGKVPIAEHPKIDDRFGRSHFPNHRSDPAEYCQRQHPTNEGTAEPILYLSPIERDLECAGSKRDQTNTDTVGRQLASAPHGRALGFECWRVLDKPAG